MNSAYGSAIIGVLLASLIGCSATGKEQKTKAANVKDKAEPPVRADDGTGVLRTTLGADVREKIVNRPSVNVPQWHNAPVDFRSELEVAPVLLFPIATQREFDRLAKQLDDVASSLESSKNVGDVDRLLAPFNQLNRTMRESFGQSADARKSVSDSLSALSDTLGERSIEGIDIKAYLRSKGSKERVQIHVQGYDNIVNTGGGNKPEPYKPFDKLKAGIAALKTAVDEKADPEVIASRARTVSELLKYRDFIYDAVSGQINLDNTSANRGDTVEIEIFLVPAEATTPEGEKAENPPRIQEDGGRTLAVDRLGLSWSFSPNVIFVNRVFGDEDDNDFEVAPAVGLNLHYRTRIDGNEPDIGERAYNFLDPGVGLNVAALDFEDNLEIGLAAQVTLFNDLLQIGYGYNLMADEDQRYWYIGIGIIETLDEIGKLGLFDKK